MSDNKTVLDDFKKTVKEFCETRDWDQFHNGKDLAIGAITEASELLEHFRFQTPEQVDFLLSNKDKREAIGEELADVFFFIIRFSQKYNFDLTSCFFDKMKKNAMKYPVKEFKGKNSKSTL